MRLVFTVSALLALPGPLWADKSADTEALRHVLFGQVLRFSPVIAGSPARAPDYAASRGGRAIVEYVPAGQTLDHWTEMHTLTGAEGMATGVTDAAAQAQAVGANFLQGYRDACALEVVSAPLGPVEVAGARAGIAGYMSCDHVRGTDHAESMVLLVILAERDVFTVQWAERGAAQARPRDLDLARVTERLGQMAQVRLCTPPPGEAAPYPSC